MKIFHPQRGEASTPIPEMSAAVISFLRGWYGKEWGKVALWWRNLTNTTSARWSSSTLSTEIIKKQSIIGTEKSFIQAKLRTIVWEIQIQETLELCSARLQNGEGLSRQKAQSYISSLSRIRIGMDLESVIQSEVSQKEKNKHCVLTHIYGI